MIDARHYRKEAAMKNGTAVVIRAIRPDDKQMLSDAFYELERESRYLRFFGFKDHISEGELKRATEVDFETEVALVVTLVVDGKEIIIGAGRYIALTASADSPPAAEVAFAVEEDYHGQGLAGKLFDNLAEIARSKGVSAFVAEVLPRNKPMIAVFERRGLPMTKKREDGLIHVSLDLTVGG